MVNYQRVGGSGNIKDIAAGSSRNIVNNVVNRDGCVGLKILGTVGGD